MALHSLALPPLCLEEMGLQTIHILVSVYSELTVSTFHYSQCFFFTPFFPLVPEKVGWNFKSKYELSIQKRVLPSSCVFCLGGFCGTTVFLCVFFFR